MFADFKIQKLKAFAYILHKIFKTIFTSIKVDP